MNEISYPAIAANMNGLLPYVSEQEGIQNIVVITPINKQEPKKPTWLFGLQSKSNFCTQLLKYSGLDLTGLYSTPGYAQISVYVHERQLYWPFFYMFGAVL